MLDNIKMLLGVADASKDTVINYWIGYYIKMVLKYCHVDALNDDLSAIVEQIVIMRMGGIGNAGTAPSEHADIAKGIKSITRGDYSVTYADSKQKMTVSVLLDEFATPFHGQLNLYRRFDF